MSAIKKVLVIFGVLILLGGAAIAFIFFMTERERSQPGVEVTFATIDKQEKGTKVSIQGYLFLPSSVSWSSETDANCVDLMEDPTYSYSGRTIVICIVEVEKIHIPEPNHMDVLGYFFEEDDFVVWLNDGRRVGYRAAVRITGWWNGSGGINPVTLVEAP